MGEFMESIYMKYPSSPIDDSGLPIDISPEDKNTWNTLLDMVVKASEGIYNKKDIDPYFLVDIGANYTLGRFEFALNVHNLFNKKYVLSGASTGLIPQKGRWFLFDVAYKF